MRNFEKTVKTRRGDDTRPIKGLILVHIGDGVWRIGGIKHIKGKGDHRVIYGPDDKEYHLWGKEADMGSTPDTTDKYGRYMVEKNRYKPDPARIKIYILTTILDKRELWTFDLKCRPNVGDIIKVIYHNGTIMTHKYDGEIKDEVISRKRYGDWDNHTIKPVAWRLF